MTTFRRGDLVRIIKPAYPRSGHEYDELSRGELATVERPWPMDSSTEYYVVRLVNAPQRIRIKHWDELEQIK